MSSPAVHPPVAYRPSRARGFTLLEVLIALVVLSVGLLGIAAMMNFSLKANDSAYMRTQALTLAYNIIDKMRANQNGALNGSYNIAVGTQVSSPPNCVGSANTCTSAQIAQYDLNQWKLRLSSTANGLPNGDGSVNLNSNNGIYEITVTVQWDDSRAAQNSSAPPLFFTTTTAL
ncbi:MAG TPA: type IV pilus modification protein PilV [Gammaproteobacteria bacterium]|nr:type IV pilus modification protein PilV [Gammaproteobacteria bacterium]